MEPSTSPDQNQSQSGGIWLVISMVFISGLAAGILIPSGVKLLSAWGNSPKKSIVERPTKELVKTSSNRTRKVEEKISVEATKEKAPEAKVLEKKAIGQGNKLAARSFPNDKPIKKTSEKLASSPAKDTKIEKNSRTKVAKNDKAILTVTKSSETPAVISKPSLAVESKSNIAMADLIEEVPSALNAQQVHKLMQANTLKPSAPVARPVALAPGQGMNAMGNTLAHSSAALPMLKSDPKLERKTYPVSINNASFSKASLGSCSKRCALLGTDANGFPIKAIIDGPTFASALQQHNGTINISGQPRIVKNQQVLIVENITFNLIPIPKATIKTARMRAPAMAPTPVVDSKGYVEIPVNDSDDLKPGTVIKNRKQIPNEGLDEIPVP